MQAITRFDGATETILNKLVDKKYYRTKSEAIRAGVLELGLKWNLSPEDENELVIRKMRQMSAEVKAGKKKTYTLEEVAKEAGVKL
jgi:Arc/MetJ-type ribon-helix-helix transcriptional regulator